MQQKLTEGRNGQVHNQGWKFLPRELIEQHAPPPTPLKISEAIEGPIDFTKTLPNNLYKSF